MMSLNESSTSSKLTENAFIQKLIVDRTKVDVFLKNGIKLSGCIVANDSDAIFIEKDEGKKEMMVYKDAISTIAS